MTNHLFMNIFKSIGVVQLRLIHTIWRFFFAPATLDVSCWDFEIVFCDLVNQIWGIFAICSLTIIMPTINTMYFGVGCKDNVVDMLAHLEMDRSVVVNTFSVLPGLHGV